MVSGSSSSSGEDHRDRYRSCATRRKIPARGSAGGGDGKRARITINGKAIDYTRQYTLNAGDVVVLETGGGGGYGKP